MTSSREKGPTGKLPPPSGNEVDAFLESLQHPRRDDIVRVRQWLLTVAPGITEAIKWNTPSFRVGTFFFASFNLVSTSEVQLVLHVPPGKSAGRPVLEVSPAAQQLMTWLSDERALVSLNPAKLLDLRAPFVALLKEWVHHVDPTAPNPYRSVTNG